MRQRIFSSEDSILFLLFALSFLFFEGGVAAAARIGRRSCGAKRALQLRREKSAAAAAQEGRCCSHGAKEALLPQRQKGALEKLQAPYGALKGLFGSFRADYT